VVFEGATAPPSPSSGLRVLARGTGKARLLRGEFALTPAADGTFSFSAIVPGRWAISAEPPRGSAWTLKSITAGGRELDGFIEVAVGDRVQDIVVTLTDRPSELAGTLQDARGRPATEYFVIAFPTDRAGWTPVSRRIQSVRPASDGSFVIKGLPGGEYYLAALTDVEPGEWLSAEFLAQVMPVGVRVRVADGQRTSQILQIVR
jgi:hypothetical protein